MASDYFQFYGLIPSFDLDEQALRKAYLQISREEHPDLYMQDAARHEQAMLRTSENNKAYETLRDKSSRIAYLLKLLGGEEFGSEKLPSEFLMEMMELNERIMDAGMTGDVDELRSVEVEFERYQTELEGELWENCRLWDREQSGEVLKRINSLYLKTKYLLRIREAIDKFADLFDNGSRTEPELE